MTPNQKALPGGMQLRATIWKGTWRGRWRPLLLPSHQVTWAKSSVFWIPCHVQHLEGKSGGGCIFVCAVSHISMCAHVYTYVGGACMCECILRWRGVSLFCPVLFPADSNDSLPLQVSLELALGQNSVASKINSGNPEPPTQPFHVFLHQGTMHSLFFPLINLLLGEALIGLHFKKR